MEHIFIGIDVGTSGISAFAVDELGHLLTEASYEFPITSTSRSNGIFIHEQEPNLWWTGVCKCTQTIVNHLKSNHIPIEKITAISVDGTSGTLVCLDKSSKPCRPAIMYNDGRGATEAIEINERAQEHRRRFGFSFNTSYAITKMLWLQHQEPHVFLQTALFIHQADFITYQLTQKSGITDYSNALKSGYDLEEENWPDWLNNFPNILAKLPKVVPPGTLIDRISKKASIETGLPEHVIVLTGCTDGVAGCLASGANQLGHTNVTIGTTLVFKTLSNKLCIDSNGLIYSHKLPNNTWLPGAASNTGAEWTRILFPEHNYEKLDAQASSLLPISVIAYPLMRKGERFPFLNSHAEGFCSPKILDKLSLYAAYLQGTAFVERLSVEALDKCTGNKTTTIFSTGSPCKSKPWTQLRANILHCPYLIPQYPESAFGSAILAATTIYNSLREAIQNMVKIKQSIEPNTQTLDIYDQYYGKFCEELRNRGYI